MDQRQIRGMELAKTVRISQTPRGWIVPSQTGNGAYLVYKEGMKTRCNCPDCELRQVKCKHQWAVEYTYERKIDEQGQETITKTIKITYGQDWKAYNAAQCKEQKMFMELLSDLCANVGNPIYTFGRPKMPLSDMVFASTLKVYSTFSLRRFTSLMDMAREKGHMDAHFTYATVSNYMKDAELTPIILRLIELSSLPLSSVEQDFAVDSSGFSTTRFARYYSFKHGRDLRYRTWIKAHVISGVKTNIVTGVTVTEEAAADSPQFKPLVEKTAENFSITEVSADKAYSARKNYEAVSKNGGMAFIPFKSNATGRSRGSMVWKKMYHYFQFNRDEFLDHYHKRSNSETVFHMVKSKFGDSVRSKTKTAQVNEVLLKFLCHNICVVIQEMHELGIEPQFCQKSEEAVKKEEQI